MTPPRLASLYELLTGLPADPKAEAQRAYEEAQAKHAKRIHLRGALARAAMGAR